MNKTDEEIATDIQKKIMELNSLLSQASDNDIEVNISKYYGATEVGNPLPRLYLTFEAKKIKVLVPHFVSYTGGC